MICPSCGTTLETKTFHSEPVEACPNCDGIWFENGEFQRTKDVALPDARWLDFDLWKDGEALKLEWSERHCPKCSKKMAVISYGNTGVMVDTCVDQHGVYLDKGEFESIINALENEIVSKDMSDYLKTAVQEGREIITGDEGVPAEWKDFTTVMRLMEYRLLVEHPNFANFIKAFAIAGFK